MSGLDKTRNVSSEPVIAPTLQAENVYAQTVTTTNLVIEGSVTLPTRMGIIAAKTEAYEIASGDENNLIQLSGSNNYTVSIPTDTTFNFAVGTQITLLNTGTGVKRIAAVTPSTTIVNATPGLKLRTQWSSATLIKLSSNNWVVVGDLVA